MILLAGLGSMILLRMIRPRVVRSVVLGCMIGATFQLTAQACRASFTYGADPRNPYVFAHTSPDLLNLVAKVEKLKQASPAGDQTVVKVIAPGGDYWPLPWYLRTFKNIGWYEAAPADPAAPIVIASTRFDLKLDERRSHLMAGIFQLRPQNFLELYVHTNIWIHYLEQNPPKREPDE